MVEGKQDKAWDHTAALLAMLANLHTDAKKRKKAFEPEDFKPKRKQRNPPPLEVVPITVLKTIFCRG
jgi:hypothetical protein